MLFEQELEPGRVDHSDETIAVYELCRFLRRLGEIDRCRSQATGGDDRQDGDAIELGRQAVEPNRPETTQTMHRRPKLVLLARRVSHLARQMPWGLLPTG